MNRTSQMARRYSFVDLMMAGQRGSKHWTESSRIGGWNPGSVSNAGVLIAASGQQWT
jgi:hypothetical protein